MERQVEIRDGACAIVVDTAHWPIVFATWFHEPTETAVKRYFEVDEDLLTRARTGRQPFVLITDTAFAKNPNASVRKLIADRTKVRSKDAQELNPANVIVVENAIVRGALTALSWILPKIGDSEIVGTIEAAIQRALALLRESGIAPPPGLTAARYKRPRPD